MTKATVICSRCRNRLEITDLLDSDLRDLCDLQQAEIERLREEVKQLTEYREHHEFAINQLSNILGCEIKTVGDIRYSVNDRTLAAHVLWDWIYDHHKPPVMDQWLDRWPWLEIRHGK